MSREEERARAREQRNTREYFKKSNITDILGAILGGLMIEQPERHLPYILNCLKEMQAKGFEKHLQPDPTMNSRVETHVHRFIRHLHPSMRANSCASAKGPSVFITSDDSTELKLNYS